MPCPEIMRQLLQNRGRDRSVGHNCGGFSSMCVLKFLIIQNNGLCHGIFIPMWPYTLFKLVIVVGTESKDWVW